MYVIVNLNELRAIHFLILRINYSMNRLVFFECISFLFVLRLTNYK